MWIFSTFAVFLIAVFKQKNILCINCAFFISHIFKYQIILKKKLSDTVFWYVIFYYAHRILYFMGVQNLNLYSEDVKSHKYM